MGESEVGHGARFNAQALDALMRDWTLSKDETSVYSPKTEVRVRYRTGAATTIEWIDVDSQCTRQTLSMPVSSTFGAVEAVARALDELITRYGDTVR